MFGFISNTWKKSKVAVIIQNVLEEDEVQDAGNVANLITGALWDSTYPDVFTGKFGDKPDHKVIACFMMFRLAFATDKQQLDGEILKIYKEVEYPIRLSAMQLMSHFLKNAHLYSFNRADDFLLTECIQLAEQHREDNKEQYDRIREFLKD